MLKRRIGRLVAVVAMCGGAAIAASAPAMAATTPHAAAVSQSVAQAKTHVTPMIGQPAGCPAGDFCAYTQTNGGQLCYTMRSSGNLGQCGNTVKSSYDYNLSYDAQLYYNSNYGGASYCLGAGSYLLYMNQNTFNIGKGKAGYGKELYNHVGSMKFVASC